MWCEKSSEKEVIRQSQITVSDKPLAKSKTFYLCK